MTSVMVSHSQFDHLSRLGIDSEKGRRLDARGLEMGNQIPGTAPEIRQTNIREIHQTHGYIEPHRLRGGILPESGLESGTKRFIASL